MSLLINMLKKSTRKNGPIPLVRQTKVGEDGLACIAMIFIAHELQESMGGLQKKYPQFSCGMSLRIMIDIFNEHGFFTRPLHCPIDDIKNLKLPCVVHWNMKQFVLLSEIDGDEFIVLNPADKKTHYAKNEFEQCYSEVALEVLASNRAF